MRHVFFDECRSSLLGAWDKENSRNCGTQAQDMVYESTLTTQLLKIRNGVSIRHITSTQVLVDATATEDKLRRMF